MVAVKIKRLGSQIVLPSYATDGSAGVDLAASVSVYLEPKNWAMVSTGIVMEIPEGYEGQIRPRSGLAYRRGIAVLNAPGTVDSDYRGEIKVLLINHSHLPQYLEAGERIAQMVFAPVVRASFVEGLEETETKRGTGGFGSTGS